jgi:hypothetical protein
VKRLVLSIGAAVAFSASALVAQDSGMHCGGEHQAQVDERGDHVMGFDHDKTTHHFRLTATGGAIEVSANDSSDTASQDAIRAHLPHIAKMFSAGDFEAPMLIHGQVPPGVPVMKRDRARITWVYAETPSGGSVVASSADAGDVAAIHEFLIFQIQDHATGDPTEVQVPK